MGAQKNLFRCSAFSSILLVKALADIGIDLQEFLHGGNGKVRKALTLHLLRPQLPVQCMIQHIFAIVVTVSCLATQLVGVTKTLFTFLHDEVEQ